MQNKLIKIIVIFFVCVCSGLGLGEAAGFKTLICYDGPTEDKSFNALAQSGFTKGINKFFPTAETASFVNKKADKLQREDIKPLDNTWNLVIGVGGQYTDILVNEAKKHTGTRYIIIEGATDKELPNLELVQFNNTEAGYLAGLVAAATTKTGNIGFLGGNKKNKAVQDFLTGYKGGAYTVNPKVVVKVNYVKSFYAPQRLKEEALDMYNNKIDVVFQAAGKSGLGLPAAAAKTRNWAIGCDSDQREMAALKEKPYVLTSVVKRLDNVVYKLLSNVARDSFQPGVVVEDYNTEGIRLVDNAENKTALLPARPYLRDADAQLMLGQMEIPMVE